ncbi:MAG: ABC transporter ATP-binding protein [Actinomycetota bacterium]|nr:ABC transporter ATP-binding protein [Actinomycetota bacterium]
MAAVELRHVTKRFEGVTAVDGIDLEVREGEFLSLLGPSGCGKTTTLRLIAGFEQPDAGEIRIGGRDVAGEPPYRRDVNTVFQSYALFPHLSVLDNVAYGLKQGRIGRERRRRRAQELLALVHLPDVGARKPRQLSGGQQQRVALARALAKSPEVLLLDEPLGALDLKLRKEMQVFLKTLHRELGTTFVYVTHDQEEALAMSDRVVVMSRGRIEQIAAPRQIYDAPATRFVADFIGETNFIRQDGRTVAVRPEQVRLGRNGSGIPGEVVTTMVVGPAIQLLVRTADGQEVLVRQQRTGSEDPVAEGDRVMLTWADGAALPLEHNVLEDKEDRR